MLKTKNYTPNTANLNQAIDALLQDIENIDTSHVSTIFDTSDAPYGCGKCCDVACVTR